MITSVEVTEREILNALEHQGEKLSVIKHKFNSAIAINEAETIKVAKNVAKHILHDLDAFLDMHPQV